MTPTDATVAQFLADICANPADDVPRLIYADWLAEYGDEHADRIHAEMIRLQIELITARHWHAWGDDEAIEKAGCKTCDLCRREALLIPRMRAPHSVYRVCSGWSYRRGFVESITLSAADWLTHADALLDAAPISRVALTTRPEVIRRQVPEGGYLACLKARLLRVDRAERWYGIDYPDSHILPHLLAAEWPRIAFTLPPV